MKKIIAIILSVSLVLSICSVIGFAEEEAKKHILDIDYFRINGVVTDQAINPSVSPLEKDFVKEKAETISIYGWVAESHEHEAFGYIIDDGEPVYSEDFWIDLTPENGQIIDDLYDWDNYRSRYDIIVPVTAETKSVTFIMRYKDGEVLNLFKANNVQEKVLDVTIYDKAASTGGSIIFDSSFWISNYTDPDHLGESVGFAFRSVGNLYKIGFKQFWASNIDNGNGQVRANLKFELYKFTGDYDESLEAEPVASVVAEAKADNALTEPVTEGTNCTMERAGSGGALLVLTEPAAPGRYLFVATEVTETEEDSTHYLVLPEQNANEYDYGKFLFYRDGYDDEMFTFDIYVYTDVEEPFGSIEASATYHNASFDTFKVNGEMAALQETDGNASDWLDKASRKVDGSDGSVQTVGFRGWIGFEETIDAFGYQIGTNAPVFDDSFIEAFADENQKNAVQAEENGGANALRFNITVPVENLEGENSIVAVVKVDGKTVRIDSALAASGAATTPDTEIIYVGKPAATEAPTEAPADSTDAPSEQSTKAPSDSDGDTSEKKSGTGVIIGIIAGVVVAAAAVVAIVLKKKKK